MGDEWQYDPFADGSKENARNEQLDQLTTFVEDYSEQLAAVESTLDESMSKLWDALTDPISLHVEPYEQTTLMELCSRGEIRTFNKVLMSFGSLVVECHLLEKTANDKFFPAFIAYGEFDDAEEGQVQQQMSRMIELLVDFDHFVDRVYTVMHNMMLQLAVLYSTRRREFDIFRSVHLQTAFDAMGKLLSVLISLDEVIGANGEFHQQWASYKRMTRDAEVDPVGFGFRDESELFTLQNLLLRIEGRLLGSSLYRNCVQQQFDIGGFVDSLQNNHFQREFLYSLQSTQSSLLQRMSDGSTMGNQRRYMGLCALYGLYLSVFGVPVDKKTFSALWEVHQVVIIVPLPGRAFWWPTEFLTQYCSLNMNVIRRPQNAVAMRDKRVREIDAQFAATIQKLANRSSIWMSRMESSLSNRMELARVVQHRLALFRDGVALASSIAAELRQISALHIALARAWHPSHVLVLCQAGELLKAIEATFHRRSAMLGESISTMIQQSQQSLVARLGRIREQLRVSKSDERLDVLAALNFAEHMLSGAATRERRVLLHLSRHVFLRQPFARPQELSIIGQELSTLEAVCDLQTHIRSVCDASALYWIRSIVPDYLAFMYAHPEHAHRIQYCLCALGDGLRFLRANHHAEPRASLAERFAAEIEEVFAASILRPLARDIDMELRFHAHAHFGVQKERHPFNQGVKHLVVLTKIRPLRFYNKTLDPRAYVEHELSKIFYDEVAVTQHKWRMFEEARSLAMSKYGLRIQESYLPGQSIDNEIDVLMVMRNIHLFVRDYHYNLNNQIFIQRSSQSKNLNSISVGVIADSIRTHGIGIMNTTVNFTFQFLKQRFITLSQFFFDEHIKARLYKDRKFYAKERRKLDNRYPFERASKFHVEIRKLGLHNGLSYLDRFRLLVNEIGNAMGYIRMIRAGGHHHVSRAIEFVPDIKMEPEFEEMVAEQNLSETSVEAARNLDSVIETLQKNFAEGSDYFRILTGVFAPDFQKAENAHLVNFYQLLPPLWINHVEHMVSTRRKLGKKGRAGDTLWTDDGLALGVAFVLKLTNQFEKHESLHFFDEADAHFAKQIVPLKDEISRIKKRDPDLEVKQATLEKLQAWRKEFQLVRFSFSGARNFFYFEEEETVAADESAAADEQPQEEGDVPEDAPPPPQAGESAAAPAPPPPPPPGGDAEFFDETEFSDDEGSWFG